MKEMFFAKGALENFAGCGNSLTRLGKVIRRTTPLPPINDEVQFLALYSTRDGKKHHSSMNCQDPKGTTPYVNVFIPEALQNILNEHSKPFLPDPAGVVCNGKCCGVALRGTTCPSFGGAACSCNIIPFTVDLNGGTCVDTVPAVRSSIAMSSAPTTNNNIQSQTA